MKITELIPIFRNDGTKVDDLEMAGIRQNIWFAVFRRRSNPESGLIRVWRDGNGCQEVD